MNLVLALQNLTDLQLEYESQSYGKGHEINESLWFWPIFGLQLTLIKVIVWGMLLLTDASFFLLPMVSFCYHCVYGTVS